MSGAGRTLEQQVWPLVVNAYTMSRDAANHVTAKICAFIRTREATKDAEREAAVAAFIRRVNLIDLALDRPKKFWHFSLPGDPRPWKRRGGFGRRSYNPSAKDQDTIAWQLRAACPDLANENDEKLWGVRLAFFGPALSTTDGDNLQKNFLDAIQGQGMAWTNDRRVRESFWVVVPDNNARTEGVIYELTADYLASWSVRK